jgi:hypothetical protein
MVKAEKVRETPPVDDSGLFDEPTPVLESGHASTWASLPEKSAYFPYDGSPVWLRGEMNGAVTTVEAQWRTTRAWSRQTKRWEPIVFWSLRNSGGMRVSFEPTAYARAV